MSTPTSASGGKSSNDKSAWFTQTKAKLTKENLDRGYYSMTDHLWMGMNDVWWGITHPQKAIPRNAGQLTMVVLLASVFGTVGYIFFGTPNSASIDLQNPSSFFKVASDHTIRPVSRGIMRAIGAVAGDDNQPSQTDENYDGRDYRR